MSHTSVLHIDGNSFFASVEQAMHPELKGRPVVTGKERGIASAMSYEAKRKGVVRGMPIGEVQRVCPEAIILSSDYETYSIFSKRMFEIVRRYTPEVEEYSIDECFALLSERGGIGERGAEQTAGRIKEELEHELNMTFSVGLAPTKVLAKVASNWVKPSGLTFISARDARDYLAKITPSDVWGIGPQTAAFLEARGITTAGVFAEMSRDRVEEWLNKPQREVWHELNGTPVYAVDTSAKSEYSSISKTKTFTPPSRTKAFLLSQLSANVENACIKLRRHGLVARQVAFFFKTQDFRKVGQGCDLSRHSASPHVMLDAITPLVDGVYTPARAYRATGVVLSDIRPTSTVQLDIFERQRQEDAVARVYESVDVINTRFGKHTVFLGSSMSARWHAQHAGDRGETPWRARTRLRGERRRRRVAIPLLGDIS